MRGCSRSVERQPRPNDRLPPERVEYCTYMIYSLYVLYQVHLTFSSYIVALYPDEVHTKIDRKMVLSASLDAHAGH